MYSNNYATGHILPDWLIRAAEAQSVTNAIKDLAVKYLKENHATISDEQFEQFKRIFNKPLVEDRLPELILPNDSQHIHSCAELLFSHLANSNSFFRQGKSLVKLRQHDSDDGERLEEITPEAFRSILGEQFDCQAIIQGDRGDYMRQKLCSLDNAKALLAANAFDRMPRIQAVLRSPVFAENENGELTVLSKGYHKANGGTYILSDRNIQRDIPVDEATNALLQLVSEFLFVTSSDKSRCLAALISPALRFGQLLRYDFPIDVCEANENQTGKTFRVKLIRTLYDEKPYVITLSSDKKGVGSFDEKLSSGLLSGSGFVILDNLRGMTDSQLLESSIRGEESVPARKAYSQIIQVKTNHIIWLATSNKAATTPDLAARSIITRLKKQPFGYVFQEYPEGNLLDHIASKRDYYLSCVFAIVREWHKAGKPRTRKVEHDFREWAGVMDYIVTQIFHLPPLLAGHRAEQLRFANPDLNWMRDVAIAAEKQGKLNVQLRTHEVVGICDEGNVKIQGAEWMDGRDDRDAKICPFVGRILKKVFNAALTYEETQTIETGGYIIERERVMEKDYHGEKEVLYYTFGLAA
jgi:hypothetical protein